MAHIRLRYLENALKKALKWSPVVGLLGMRQSGKTTLLSRLGQAYHTFDDASQIRLFETSGVQVLETGPYPMVLDEVQKAPFLFDQIKLVVDRKKKPGQFMLTGSVRFSSKRNIRESLTGRVSTFELLPLTLRECHNLPLGGFISSVLNHSGQILQKKMLSSAPPKKTEVAHYLLSGGLPGICLKRETKNRSRLFDQHLDTLLGSDIQILLRTEVSPETLRQIFLFLCLKQGLPINYSELARQVRLSSPTISNILKAFEGLFLIRKLGKCYFIEDVGLWNEFFPLKQLPEAQKMTALVYAELKSQLNYQHDSLKGLSEHRTKAGSHIPFVISVKGKPTLYITVDAEIHPTHKSLVALNWALKKDPGAKAVALHNGDSCVMLESQVLSLPYHWIY